MIEYKTDSSKGNHNIHVETDNYKYYRIIEEFVRMFIDHKLDFININEGADKDNRDNKENYDKGYTDGYAAATGTMQIANEKQNDNINSAIKRIRKFCRTQGKCSKCPIYTKVSSNPCMFRYGISPEYWHTLDISIDKDDEEDE